MDYVNLALRTESLSEEVIQRLSDPKVVRLLHAAMGLTTEAGELVDMLKKHIFYGKPLDEVNVIEELGDSFWYAAIAIDVVQTTLDEVMTRNVAKLRQRYPEKFTEQAALERNLDAERRILEDNGDLCKYCGKPFHEHSPAERGIIICP